MFLALLDGTIAAYDDTTLDAFATHAQLGANLGMDLLVAESEANTSHSPSADGRSQWV